MNIQLDSIINLLTALLTGGVIMILFENLHLNKTLSDRFYNKMQPFMHKLTCYIRFVDRFKLGLRYKDKNQEFVAMLDNLVAKVVKYNNDDIISGKDLGMSTFSANSISVLCYEVINKIWYVMSEHYNDVMPYLDYRPSTTDGEQYIKEQLRAISDKYDSLPINKFLLLRVSGDFYNEVYMPVSNTYLEYEYWQSESKKYITGTLWLLVLIFLSIFFIIILGNTPCYCINIVHAILAIVCSMYFGYLVWKMAKIYEESIKLVQ